MRQVQQSADDRVITLEASLSDIEDSDIEDSDLAMTIIELQIQQLAYEAALRATQRTITTSLADFLR